MQTMPLYQFQVVQSGSSIIITTPTWPPEAQLNGAGSVTPSGTAFFYLEARGKHTDVKGMFILLCFGMIWKMTDIFGEEEYTFLRTPIKIVEPTENDLIITSEPRMPNFNAKVVLDNLIGLKNDIPSYTWGIRIHHDIGSDMHINAYLDNIAGDDASYRPNFNNLKEIMEDGSTINIPGAVVGGVLTLSVDYYRNLHVEKNTLLKEPILVKQLLNKF
jgi:hypothetical protein